MADDRHIRNIGVSTRMGFHSDVIDVEIEGILTMTPYHARGDGQ
jgi:hypothetical protein